MKALPSDSSPTAGPVAHATQQAATAVASQVPPAIAQQLRTIGPLVDPQATALLYAPLAQREPYAGVRVERGLRYGSAERHLLDVFAPQPSSGDARAVLVFIHGGAFVGGDRRRGTSPFYDNVMLWAVAHGMVGVNMTYRLAPQTQWPGAQEDLARAVAWVREHIAARGGDPQRIYLMGHSAGGAHVAQYLGHPRLEAVPGGGVAGAIIVSGLYDIGTAEVNPPLVAYFGNDRARHAEQSALPGLVRSQVPLLLAYAELDPPDFQQQAEEARAALCAAGRCPAFAKLLGHSHMSEVYAINTADHALTDAMQAFLLHR